MPTKNQHFVPRVYLKAWETQVENHQEPNKQFQGVYIFKNGTSIGEGRTVETILWKQHLYTIKFDQLYIANKCPAVYSFYVNAVYDTMINNQPSPVYGKLGYSVIKTKQSVRKHLKDIENWDFYYHNGDMAKKKALLNRIRDIRCYILEDAFSQTFENSWETIKNTFIHEVKNGIPVALDQSERLISEKAATDMLSFFFMMLCRSPNFDAMGIYTWINNILVSAFGISNEIDEMMEAVWFTELYRMFFKEKGGFFHTVFSQAFSNCQLILFEAYSNAEMFITSDSPAFQNDCKVLRENENGFIFPLSPKYLLFIAKGNGGISTVDYRYANRDTVRHFNRIIKNNSHDSVVGINKQLSEMI